MIVIIRRGDGENTVSRKRKSENVSLKLKADSGHEWLSLLDQSEYAPAALKCIRFALKHWLQIVTRRSVVQSSLCRSEKSFELSSDSGGHFIFRRKFHFKKFRGDSKNLLLSKPFANITQLIPPQPVRNLRNAPLFNSTRPSRWKWESNSKGVSNV